MTRWLRFFLKACLTLGALGALVFAVEPSTLADSLRRARWPWILGAVLLLPVNLALEYWVWRCLLESVPPGFSARDTVGALLCGHALGFWTPIRAGEFAGRSLYFSSGDRGELSLTVLAQRMVDMAVGVNIGLLMLLLALWAGTIPVSLPWLAGVGIGLCVGLGLTSILLNPAWAHRWAEWLIPSTRWDPDRTALLKRITSWQGLQVTIGTGARYVVFTGQFACLAWALAPSLSAWSVAVAVSLTYYAKYLLPSLTLLDLGIREGAAVYFFTGFGMGGAVGLNAALLLFSINVLVPAALGLPFVPQLSLPAVGSKQPWSHVRSTLVPF